MLMDRIIPHSLERDRCRIQERWRISWDLCTRIHCMAERLPFGVSILSGFRTAEKQQQLYRDGKGAPVHLSTHCSCPATGADLWPDIAVTKVVKATFGEAATACGLRWGGGSPVDEETGIPSDWNHVDLGPRKQAT